MPTFHSLNCDPYQAIFTTKYSSGQQDLENGGLRGGSGPEFLFSHAFILRPIAPWLRYAAHDPKFLNLRSYQQVNCSTVAVQSVSIARGVFVY